MNTDLTALKPALVWKHFAAMTQIPRPSFHEEKIRRYVLDVAQSLFLILKIQVGQFAQSVYNNSEELGMFREKTLCECRYLGRRS